VEANGGLIPCPGGCGGRVHPNARECPQCGYQSEMGRMEDLLGSLGTISSILIGFGLAALVQLATEESRKEWALQWTSAVWIVSSLLLLGVLVSSEVLRRRDVGGGRMRLSREEDQRLWRRSEWLLLSLSLALLGTAAGVVLLGFYFSVWHGVAGCLAVAAGFFLLWRTA
jgi:Na+/melibiose symporter-like transporter